MPNEYKRKTNRGMASKEIYELASEEVMLRNKSLRDAATSYDINHTSLYRYIKKKQAYQSNKAIQPPSIGYHRPTVFTKEEEKSLCEYVLTCSDANFGLSTKEARKLAYKLAVAYDEKCPSSWMQTKMAGDVWLRLFMKRHEVLSLRLPQATSIARATSFNRTNVELFLKIIVRYLTNIIWKQKTSGMLMKQS
ncbi:unnamed protein product [Acanthoscelides obtectus]|uniref:HTH CENPB-type domain-containing protein n=1 Tax=Acanthoscelides obtectus TaxID=200917 RepID=A0A9P0QCD6_ACAOB|nr:unnamed protein product [Acanthoscelides obtectus]CAK1627180.1 hypothetical protein AOBTE_LOCUS4363 [Acanthoscelides obtectus]